MAELLLDTDIRLWVFLPIVVITFLTGLIRNYVTVLLSSEKQVELHQIKHSQLLKRSRLLRENGKYLPRQAFLGRKAFFNDEDKGFFTKEKEKKGVVKNPMTDPSMMTDMMKGNITNVLPMIVIGGWINWAFSGFLTTKVPFPLTYRFKPMLQRGVELPSLDASWVSSASWYFLNVFGLRGLYTIVLGSDNAADQTRMMQEQFSGQAMAPGQDPAKAFQGEWEALEMVHHVNALQGVEEELAATHVTPEILYLQK